MRGAPHACGLGVGAKSLFGQCMHKQIKSNGSDLNAPP